VSFLLRTAHDKAMGKEEEDPEITMKAQIKQLAAQIETGEQARANTGSKWWRRLECTVTMCCIYNVLVVSTYGIGNVDLNTMLVVSQN